MSSAEQRGAFLSTLPAGGAERRFALATVAVSTAIFLGLAPFAKVQLAPVPAFIPVYQSALAVNDLITAILLLGQFAILRSRALLLLACGYLFTAFMAGFHMLTFPGLFAPDGLLGAGPQSTAWIYMFWHGGFPLLVAGYVLLRDRPRGAGGQRWGVRSSVLGAVAAAFAAAGALTFLATAWQGALPPIMRGNNYTPAMIGVVTGVWLLSVAALVMLSLRKPHTVLDLWLMVVMCAWLFDIALAAVLNHGRFDLGFYAGRIYGLLAASFVLVVLLLENSVLYSRLAASHGRERERTAQLQAANRELEAFSYSVSHDLRAPLRAVDGFARMLEDGYAHALDAEGKRLLGVVRDNSRRMGGLIDDLLEFSRIGRAAPARERIDMTVLAREAAAEAMGELRSAVEIGELPAAAGDRALLRQVWLNLIANALKYSGTRERPLIQIGGKAQDGELVYWVRDNGVGFDMGYAHKLFGVFQRLHREDEFPGTGVGLAIVQRVLERHGGRAWAEGTVGEGACFYFSLPAKS